MKLVVYVKLWDSVNEVIETLSVEKTLVIPASDTPYIDIQDMGQLEVNSASLKIAVP